MPRRSPILTHDPTAAIDHHRPDDRFIPVRACNLLKALVADAPHWGADGAAVAEFAEALERVIVQDSGAFERDLAERYNNVNPDRDTIQVGDGASLRTPAAYADLTARLDYLLSKANFTQLKDVDITSAVHAANSRGLHVRLHPQRLLYLAIWVRGRAEIELCRRTWRTPRGQLQRLQVFRRLAVVARLKDDPNVQLKMFKEIPTPDVEALLPHAEVEMNWYDRLKLMGGGAGMLGTTATKLLEVASGAIVLSRLLWVLMFGAGVLCVRTFFGYRNVRARRDLQRTTNLYYQNLANNAGVIHSLVSMTAQEDFKEVLLAYLFCHADGREPAQPAAPPSGRPFHAPCELAQRIERYLHERFDVHFAFDVEDARTALERLGLWADAERVRVIPAAAATQQLREHWLACRTERYHIAMAGAAAQSDEGAGHPGARPGPADRVESSAH